MTDTFVSSYPAINYGLLKRAGVFKNKGVKFGFNAAGIHVLVWFNEDNTVQFWWKGLPDPVRVHLAKVDQTFGQRGYFLCPEAQVRCQKLVWMNGVFASPVFHRAESGAGGNRARQRAKVAHAAARLLGHHGHGPVRGARRDRLLAVLPKGRDALPSPEIQALLNERETRDRRGAARPLRSSRKTGPLSTAAAIQRGRELESSDAPLTAPLQQPAPEVSLTPPAGRDLAFIEDHPALDMRVLQTSLALREGTCASVRLVWPEQHSGGAVSFAVFVDLRPGPRPTLTIQSILKDGRALRTQVLNVIPSQPDTPLRWFLMCPLSGRQCDILFLRDQIFASAKAQHLIYRSERQRAKRMKSPSNS